MLKPNAKVIDNVTSDKHVKSFIKNDYRTKKVESPINNIVVYDLEAFKKFELFLIGVVFIKLIKISGKNHQDKSKKEYQQCLNDCVVFKGIDRSNEMLDHVLSSKEEPKRVKNKIVG